MLDVVTSVGKFIATGVVVPNVPVVVHRIIRATQVGTIRPND